MPKLLYMYCKNKITALVTSSGHSALRHEVSRMFTILPIYRLVSHPQYHLTPSSRQSLLSLHMTKSLEGQPHAPPKKW